MREDAIRRIQTEFGYSYEDAEKVLEVQNYKTTQFVFNAGVGLFAANRVGPLHREVAHVHPLFRKAWMRYPIQLTAFGGAFFCANKLTTKLFNHFSFMNFYRPRDGRLGVSAESYQGGQDLVAKFRIFEDQRTPSAKDEIQQYLDVYQSGPLTKAELLNRMADGLPVDPKFASKFQIKRRGKDKDDVFWSLGKVHGLENIAYLTEDQILATGGNPFELQRLVDRINDSEKPLPPSSHDSVVSSLHEALENYRNAVDSQNSKK